MFKKIGRIILYLVLLFFVSTIVSIIIFKWLPVRYTPLMTIRYFENINDKNFYTQKKWTPIEDISPNMLMAVIASEDNKFINHSGFDWDAIDAALKHNKKSKRKRGASTITQQVAKNVFLISSRTWVRKGLEAYFTILIEFFWNKERIIEVYLNVIETGKGIYGVEAAAQRYFNKPARKLTREEAALIAAALPNPRERNPANPTAYMRQRQQQIMRVMKQLGDIDVNTKNKKDEKIKKKK
ncbi:MAG: monofunctional biosynthetic peptidoglycan transglycosylase [Prevotellaceae bacterium]|nr:monofunctional biosynthetic peptidoglycan transglycosylase [Prevotellaceae bacterium]